MVHLASSSSKAGRPSRVPCRFPNLSGFFDMRVIRPLALIAAAIVPAAATAQAPVLALGVDTMNFDKSVRPQDDFFKYANGGWLKKTQVPSDASRWGAFNELDQRSKASLHSILEELTHSKAAVGGERRKVAGVYAAFMDSSAVESLGLAPIQGEIDAIPAIRNNSQLPAAFAREARNGVNIPFRVVV